MLSHSFEYLLCNPKIQAITVLLAVVLPHLSSDLWLLLVTCKSVIGVYL